MPKELAVHVMPALNGGWSVVKAGAQRASKHFETKEAAVDWGRAMSRQQRSVFFIHREDGTVQERISHDSNSEALEASEAHASR